MSVEFVVLAAPRDVLAAEEGQECTNKADIFPWHIRGLCVIPGLERQRLLCSSRHCHSPELSSSPSVGGCEGQEFISLLNPEIPPYPRKERGIPAGNAPGILPEQVICARPGVEHQQHQIPSVGNFSQISPKFPTASFCC